MKKFLGIIVCFSLAGLCMAQNGLKIGCVDLDRIMFESQAIRNVVSGIQDDIKKEEESVTEKLTRYKVLSETFEKQKTILTEDQIETRQKELKELKTSIKGDQDKINRMISKSEKEIVEPTIKLVDKAIKTFAEQNGYDMILRGDTVLYVSKKQDITDKIILKIDEDYNELPANHKNPANSGISGKNLSQ